MELLQQWLEGSTFPVLTAFLLGLLTSISPCPLATNIAAVGYLARTVEDRRAVLRRGLLYTLGRVLAYTVLGVVLIALLRAGASLFAVEKAFGRWGEAVMSPLLFLVGLYLLFEERLPLPKIGFRGQGEGLVRRGGWGALLLGLLFALAFCPTSGLFYFGVLIPMSASEPAGYLLPAVFAVATSLPVVAVAWLLASGVAGVGAFYNRMCGIQQWMRRIVGWLFLLIGIYSGIQYFLS